MSQGGTRQHTEEAEDGAEKGARLKGRGDVARDRLGARRPGDAEVVEEALAGDGGADEGRVVAEPRTRRSI